MLAFQGRRNALDRAHDGRAWTAWHIAMLGRWPAKRALPALKELLSSRRRSGRPIGRAPASQSDDDTLAALRMITAAAGGTIRKRER